MTTISLQARLHQLSETLKQTQQLTSRLSKFPSTPGASRNNPDEGDARVELSNEIHQSLKEQEEDFDLIRQEAEDLISSSGSARRRDKSKDNDRERERSDLKGQVDKFDADLKIARAQFRKAQLQAKKNAEAAQRKERELLFAGIQDGSSNDSNISGVGGKRRRGQEAKTQDEVVLGASDDVTAALRRTYNLMSSELERSQFAHETLENSTKELALLTENYSNLDTLLSSSKNLVGTLIRSQKSDTWYLETAFYVLVITIGWLVFRRIIYGPSWWLVYFPLKTLWWATQLLLGSVGALFGIAGAEHQSIALTEASASQEPGILGTGKRPGIPTFPPNMPAPSIRVGAGGYGAKAENAQQERSDGNDEEKPLSDQVGEMAEKSRLADNTKAKSNADSEDGTVLRERTAEDGPPNPKKRMWEEPAGDVGSKPNPRDEL